MAAYPYDVRTLWLITVVVISVSEMTRTAYASFPGFAPEEIRTDRPTREARLKWVVVVDDSLTPGRAVNAAVCVAAATAPSVAGLLGEDAIDHNGSAHPGLPWLGATILAAPAEALVRLRTRAVTSEGVFVADMPAQAQDTRVYDEYLAELADASDIRYLAVGVIGPRNRVAKLVDGFAMLA